MIIIPNQAPISIHFKGARMVVIDKVKHKQSYWNRLWTGKIIYKQNPAITAPITFKPTNKGKKILFVADRNSYQCVPNQIGGMQPANIADIKNKQNLIIS